ncbi:MAG: alginate export family protein [Nitrospirae bacterium]|nr:alginate export family protein [Nitrospirota bacterium]
MKKFLAIVLSSLFVLGIAGVAFAVQAEIPADTTAVTAKGATNVTIDGSIRIRGAMSQLDMDSDVGGTSSSYDHRVTLGATAKLEKVTGRILFEAGGGASSDVYTPGTNDGATGVYTQGNAKQSTPMLLESWILYKGDKVGLKAGHMPLALGNNLFFNHTKFGDDAIVLFMDPTKEIHVGLLTIKIDEESSEVKGNTEDSDAYVGLMTFKSEAFNASADITYLIDGDFLAANGLKFYNIGLRGDTKVGPLTVKADLELQSGSVEEGVSATQDYDLSGSAIMLGASMKLDPVSLSLEIGRGSGDDSGTANELETFVTSLGAGAPYPAFIYGPRVKTAANATNTGIANTQYIKVGAGAKVGPVDVKADLLLLTAVEEVDLGSSGTKSDDLGMEFDAKGTYKLAKNLTYWIEGGYFMPGDAYKTATKDADSAWALRHGLELSF